MKKLYLFVILLFCGLGYAQVNLSGNATYALKISGEVGADGSSCGDNVTRGLQWVASNDIRNNAKTIVQGSASYPNNGHGLTAQTFDPPIVYFTDFDKIKELYLRTTKRDRGTGGCKDVQYGNATIPVTTDNFSQNFDFSGLSLNQSGNIQVDVYPIINLMNPDTNNNIVGTNTSIKIPQINGIDPKYFNWMYHIDGERRRIRVGPISIWVDVWRSLPDEYQGINSLNIECGKFLDVFAIGKKIWLRANTTGSTVEMLYAKSSPHITAIDPIQTRCFDSEDGRAIMRFSSKLAVGETMTITVMQLDDKGVPMNEVYSTQPHELVVIGDDLTYEIPYDFFKGNFKVSVFGWYKEPNKVGANTYVMDPEHQKTFQITSPTPVDFSIIGKEDIKCYGGKDGIIKVKASGGIDNGIYQYSTNDGTSWTDFTNGAETNIPNLLLGIHFVKVRKIKDANDKIGCIAQASDKDKELSEEITQPDGPLVLVGEVFTSNPTFHNAEDGIITASFSGGTLISGKSYSFTWTNSKNETIDAGKSTTQFLNNIFSISLKNVPADTYRLSVTDERGCTINEKINKDLKITLDNPEPIEITIEVLQGISCNSESLEPMSNEDKAEDGILKAKVKGGVPFKGSANGGRPYIYFWSKYNDDTKKWDDLKINDSIAKERPKGTYSINVQDANGIMRGTYTLTEKTPIAVDTTIVEPDAMKVEFSSKHVSCFQGSNGSAKASIKNGKSTYTCTWYGPGHYGTVAEEITNLTAGTYYVDVVDNVKGCFVRDSIEITEPLKEVTIDYKSITPTFSGAANGSIVAKITGGTPFEKDKNDVKLYNFEWKNLKEEVQAATFEIIDGVFTISLENLPADNYYLTVKDKNYDEGTGQITNCSILKFKVQLTEPDPLKVVFEVVQTISCNAKNEFGDKKDTAPKDEQRDESQDGILMAHVTGGTPLDSDKNNRLPYYFYWKKQQDDGTWKDLAVQDSIISNLSHGNYALNVKDKNDIILGTYTNGNWIAKDSIQFMDQPPILSVKIEKGDVFCHGGNDGWATAIAEGGTGKYKYKWSNDYDSDKNTFLKKGVYSVIATDEKGCTAYAEVTIKEPDAPLTIKDKKVTDPSFYKATNGKIIVEVTGGTIFKDNTYWFEWKNSKGVTQTATASFSNDIYTITLNGLGEETYTLTVRDANYSNAKNKTSCTVSNFVVELEDPDPLEVTFEVIRTISCNVSNEFGNETDAKPLDNQRDESQDGILKAHVKGGIQLDADQNNGLPYYYTWKKKQADGSWTIWNNAGDTAEYLSEGTYALNIEDANGIKLGTYVNNALVKEIDAEKYMEQPDQLKLTFTKFDVGCTTGDDGWAEAHVTGGTTPYTYEWTNGETTFDIKNITTNNYFVKVTDAKGCVVQGSIFVGDPNGILTTEKVKNPTCYKGNDGSIELNVTGGNLPYTYLWNTGAATKDLNNLTAGNYEVAITCPDCCVYKKRFVLKDPEPVIVNIGPDRTLCLDQSLDLDASIKDPQAKYSWTSTNGFTSNEAKINVSKAGTYHVKVTSALGCIGEDEIVIKTSRLAISAEFLLSSQAYLDEEVILVNTSSPFGESTDWVVPSGVKVVEQKEKYITLKFDAIGVYSIGLKQTQGECYAVYTKNIMVEQRGTLPNTETASQFIIDFIVTPNPSNGNFKAIVNLENNSAVNLRLFSSSGQNTMIQKQDSGKKKYEVDFNTSLQSGMYILVLETGQQTLVKKIIIN